MASKIEHFVASDGWQYADVADFLLGEREPCTHNWDRAWLELQKWRDLAAQDFADRVDKAAFATLLLPGMS